GGARARRRRASNRERCAGPRRDAGWRRGTRVAAAGGAQRVRVFLAGATGAIGRRLVPLLKSAGHQVTGMTRSPAKADALRAMGAEPTIADALDADAVREALAAARPEAVIHELTALPQRIDPRRVERDFEPNDRLRSEGTRIL